MIAKLAVRYMNEQRKVQQAYRKGLNKSLDRAGTIMRRNAQRQLSSRKPRTKPTFYLVGEQDGTPMVAATFRPSKSGKVTSWKTSRNAKGYLRSAIRYAKDMRAETVVVGPSDKAAHVNELQEFGGSATQEFRLVSPTPIDQFAGQAVKARGLQSGQARPQGLVGLWVDRRSSRRGQTAARRSVRVPAGRFMGKGLTATIPKLPDQFKGLVQGP